MITLRTVRYRFPTLLLILACAVQPSLEASTAPNQTTGSQTPLQQPADAGLAERAFSSGFELFYAGPQWFLNALPGWNTRARATNSFAYDPAGDRVEVQAPYAGARRDVSDLNLFSDAPFFAYRAGRTNAPLAPEAVTGTAKDFFQNANMSASGNYNPAGLPSNTTDVRITTSVTALTLSTDLSMESLNVANGSTYTLVDSSATNRTLTLGNAAGFTNVFSTVNNDLVYLTGGSSLVINAIGSAGTLGVALASSGNFNVGSGSILNISSDISGAGRSITISNFGTVIFGGTNTYSGDTFVNAGDLRFAAGGSSNNSTIRLGNTLNSPPATLSLGNSFGTSGGVNVSSPLDVRLSAGTTGTRLLRSLATTGTNTYSGVITLNSDLTVQSSSNLGFSQGTLLFEGGSIDLGLRVLTVNDALDGIPGNFNTQGIVRINELIAGEFGSIVKNGGGTLIIQSTANTYGGGTTIGGGLLGIYGDQSLGAVPSSPATNVQFTGNGTLQDTANDITIAANRNISIANGATATFDSNGNIFTINSVVSGTVGNLNKIGPGTLVLTGANTYGGMTTISQGVLNAAATGALGATSGILVNSGGTLLVTGSGNLNRINDAATITLGSGAGNATFERGGNGVVSEGVGAQRTGPGPLDVTGTTTAGLGALTLQGNATFDFGTGGVGTFVFDTFTANGNTLTILNWNNSNADVLAQTSGIDGIDDRLIFSGAPTELAFINFDGRPAGFVLLDTGFYELVPVPEPSTRVGAALALGAIGFMQRRRFRSLLAHRRLRSP